jgi:uncharacterized protein (TIGR02271 family)
MIDLDDVTSVIGRNVVSSTGEKIGKAGQVYVDDTSGRPEWVTVSTGLFGTKETFVPLAGASVSGDDLVVPYDKDRVKDAPNLDPAAGHLSPAEERELFDYYGVAGYDDDARTESVGTVATGGTYDGDAGVADDGARGRYAAGRSEAGVGHDTSGPNTDDAMTRSEERVSAGTEQVEAGRARLRKWIETEQVDVPVTVTREKARLETEPITDANRDAAYAGADLSEEEHEVVLTEERPVVAKETVPVERVRLTKDVETEEAHVSEEVRKERIAMEGDGRTGPVR